MSKLLLFNAVSARILAEVSEITSVKLWNNQLVNEKKEEAREYPIAYFHFSVMDWKDLTKGLQEGDIIITIHVVVERYETDDKTFLTIVDNVYKALQQFQDDFFTPIKRVGEDQDDDHDNCIDWMIRFSTQLRDATADEEQDKTVLGTVPDLEVGNDLVIDNPEGQRTAKEIV